MPGPEVDEVGLAEPVAEGLAVAVGVPAVVAAVAGVVGAAAVGLEIPGPTQPVSTSTPAASALPSCTVFTLLARGGRAQRFHRSLTEFSG